MWEGGCYWLVLQAHVQLVTFLRPAQGHLPRGSTAPPVSVNSQENATDMPMGQWKHSLD